MSGLHLLTPEEKNALAVLADAVDRCREEDMRTPEVLASLDVLARSTSPPGIAVAASKIAAGNSAKRIIRRSPDGFPKLRNLLATASRGAFCLFCAPHGNEKMI